MDIGNRVLHRAYVLVEADIPTGEAIEDLVTLARGDVSHLEAARHRADAGGLPESDGALESIGFEPDLLHTARARRAGLNDLLERAIASFG